MDITKRLSGLVLICTSIITITVIYLIFLLSSIKSNPFFMLVPFMLLISIVLLLILNKNVELSLTETKHIDKAKQDFVSLASHQLCTPLAAINWYSEMLLAGDAGELNKEQKKYVETIYHSIKRMIILVNALLNVSRIDLGTFSIEPEAVDLEKIADGVLASLPKTFKEKGIKIIKKYDENLPPFNGDPNLTRLIFQNILSNSVKYTPEKGEVRLSVRKKSDHFLIKVKDSGCGIPEDQQSKIFTKLFRAENVRRLETDGTGLGLYIVKSIVEQSGGTIWFESTVGEGTTFFIKFPLSGMKKKSGTKRLG
jgi:signal transduction histidine kinase